jgi:hypothetical protein
VQLVPAIASGAAARVVIACVGDETATAAARTVTGACVAALAGDVPVAAATRATVRIDVRSFERFIFITY